MCFKDIQYKSDVLTGDQAFWIYLKGIFISEDSLKWPETLLENIFNNLKIQSFILYYLKSNNAFWVNFHICCSSFTTETQEQNVLLVSQQVLYLLLKYDNSINVHHIIWFSHISQRNIGMPLHWQFCTVIKFDRFAGCFILVLESETTLLVRWQTALGRLSEQVRAAVVSYVLNLSQTWSNTWGDGRRWSCWFGWFINIRHLWWFGTQLVTLSVYCTSSLTPDMFV